MFIPVDFYPNPPRTGSIVGMRMQACEHRARERQGSAVNEETMCEPGAGSVQRGHMRLPCSSGHDYREEVPWAQILKSIHFGFDAVCPNNCPTNLEKLLGLGGRTAWLQSLAGISGWRPGPSAQWPEAGTPGGSASGSGPSASSRSLTERKNHQHVTLSPVQWRQEMTVTFAHEEKEILLRILGKMIWQTSEICFKKNPCRGTDSID